MAQRAIFICHARTEARLCQQLAEMLEAAGVSVAYDTYDLLPPANVASHGTSPPSATLEQDLRAAHAFLVLLSKDALASARIRSEAHRYHNLHAQDPSRMIIPIVVGEVDSAAIWWFLLAYPRVEVAQVPGEQTAQFAALSIGVLSALGLPVPARLFMTGAAPFAQVAPFGQIAPFGQVAPPAPRSVVPTSVAVTRSRSPEERRFLVWRGVHKAVVAVAHMLSRRQ
jgi:TIR domain